MKVFILLFNFFLLATTISTANVITIDNETYFHVENEIYSSNSTDVFEVVAVDTTYILFNNSNFFLNSVNNINITYGFIRHDIPTAHMNELVMSFHVNTTSAAVAFRISGFQPRTKYKVYKDGDLILTPTSSFTGYILFTNAGWGTPEPYIEIYEFMYGEEPAPVQHDMKFIPFLALLPLGFVFWKSGIIIVKRKKKREII